MLTIIGRQHTLTIRAAGSPDPGLAASIMKCSPPRRLAAMPPRDMLLLRKYLLTAVGECPEPPQGAPLDRNSEPVAAVPASAGIAGPGRSRHARRSTRGGFGARPR